MHYLCFMKLIQWNPVNTDTKGTGQILRIKGVSVLRGVTLNYQFVSKAGF